MERSIFLKNLNCFIPMVLFFKQITSGAFIFVILLLFHVVHPDLEKSFLHSPLLLNAIGILISIPILLLLWRKFGLYIEAAKEGKEGIFRFGHTIIAFATTGSLAFLVLPLIMRYGMGIRDAGLIWAGGALIAFSVATILWIIGLIMVYTSKESIKIVNRG